MKVNKLITGLLALLGFSSCVFLIDGDDDGGDDVVMYGVVRTSFVVKGTVTDADEKPLKNIRVVLKLQDDEPDGNPYRQARDTVYTDNKGEFKTRPRPDTPLPWTLIATDIDGTDNGGEFLTVEKTFTTIHNGNFDYDERVYVNEMDFSLEKVEENNENE